MAQTLVNWGVTHVFGMVGHSNLGLADALRRQEAEGTCLHRDPPRGGGGVRGVGYGKLTGRPAACLTIAGPGATNLLTGLWDAKVDRSPVIALTGQVDTQVLGPGAFQEVDLPAAFGSVAAFSQTVLRTAGTPSWRASPPRTRSSPRRLALIFPDEVQTLPAAKAAAAGPEGRLRRPRIDPPRESLDAAVELLGRPATGGHRRPWRALRHGAIIALAERLVRR